MDQAVNFSSGQMVSLPSADLSNSIGLHDPKLSGIRAIVVDKALPQCSICYGLPVDPVSKCDKTDLPLFDRHLLCRKCAIQHQSPECPTCRETSGNITCSEKSSEVKKTDSGGAGIYYVEDREAAVVIKGILDCSLYLCPQSCGSLFNIKDLKQHLAKCNGPSDIENKTLKEKKKLTSRSTESYCSDCSVLIPSGKINDHVKNCPENMIHFRHFDPITESYYPLEMRNRIVWQNEEIKRTSNQTDLQPSYQISRTLSYNSLNSVLKSSDHGATILNFTAVERIRSGVQSKNYVINASEIKLMLNSSCLEFEIKKGKINTCKLGYEMYEEGKNTSFIPDRFLPYSRYYGGYPIYITSLPVQKVYTLQINAVFSDEYSPIVCKQDFRLSDIDTLNSIYKQNKNNSPKSFVDLIEFFSPVGLSRFYIEQYGPAFPWTVRLLERDINESKPKPKSLKEKLLMR